VRFGREIVAVATLSMIGLLAGAQEAKREEPTPGPRQATPRLVPASPAPGAPAIAGTPTFPLSLGTLPSGKGVTIVFRAVVANPFTGTTPSVSNQGAVSGTGFGPVPTDDPDTGAVDDPTVTPVDLHPDLALTKSDGGASVAPGGTVGYALGYMNLSTFGAPGVALAETVPANTTFNAGASTAGWTCTPNNNAGSTCTLAIGTVAGGASASATFAVTVVNPVAAGVAQIANTASVSSTLSDPVPGNNTASDTTPVNAAPDLTLTKSDGGVSVAPGGSVTYTLGYTNAGNQGATGVVLTETVPANTTFTGSGWTCTPNNNAGSSCTRPVGSLAGGGTPGSAAFAVTVVNPVPAGVAQISNTASIADDATNGPDPTPADNTATDTTPVDAAPDLTLSKGDGGVSTTPGATVAYTLTFSNAGNQGASGVILTDVVPANTTFNPGGSSAGWSCTPNNNAGSSCTNTVGAVTSGSGPATRTFAVTVVSPVPAGVTQISNTATIADDGTNGPDPTPANNSASDTTPVTAAPDLTLSKSDGGVSTTPGGTVAYALLTTNVGDQGASGVVLTDVVPVNTTFNPGGSSAGWTCTPNNNAGSSCTLAVGTLAGGGATSTVNFAVTVDDPIPNGVTQVSNTASVVDDGTNGPDPTPANNTSSDTTPVVAAPDMTIAKSDGGITTTPGSTVAYTLAYANTGNRGATGVVLTDVVPASTTFNAGASTAGWTCVPDNNAGSSCTLAIGTVAAGGNGSATFAVTVANPVPAGLGSLSNTATVADDGTNGTDPNPSNNTSTDTTPVDAAPDLTLDKDDGGVSTTPGSTVAYALTYANAGNQGAAAVVLSETVPAATTFDAGASTAGWTCVPDANAGSACTLTLGALAAGGGGTATFAVDVLDPAPSGVVGIANTASIADDGANGPDPTPANNTDSDTTPVTAAPDLSVVKSDGGASTAPGGTVVYALSYRNDGDQDALGVVLTDVVPALTTFDPTGSSAGWSCTPDNAAGSTCTLTVGALAGGGAGGSVNYSVIVDATVPSTTTEITNTGTIADDGTNGPDPTPADNSSTDTTPLASVPDVTVTELVHGSLLVESLASLPGPTADVDTYRLSQKPYSSYEVVVDGTAGDVATGGNGPGLDLLAADGTTIVQVSAAVGTGTSRALRFYNATSGQVDDQTIRVRSNSCGTNCPAETRYRIRAYETTYTLERFNNVAPQVTVVILNNTSERPVDTAVWLWNGSGGLVGFTAFTIPPRGLHVFDTSQFAPSTSGSITVSNNGAYGVLTGKAAVLDPVNGPAQDVILRPRIR
jgi:large repetitive protein